VVLGPYVAAALVAELLAFAGLPGTWSVGAALVAWDGAFLIGLLLVRVVGSGWSVLGGMLAGLVFVLSARRGARDNPRNARGVTVHSTVIDVSSSDSRRR
jgi:hypothetical protein